MSTKPHPHWLNRARVAHDRLSRDHDEHERLRRQHRPTWELEQYRLARDYGAISREAYLQARDRLLDDADA
jgi:hypothetical protein